MTDQMHPEGYFDNPRSEVAALVPPGSQRILDIGCGRGQLGVLLKQQRGDRTVVGVEHNSSVAEDARGVLDAVLTGDIESMDLDLPGRSFDCILCADVLEHLHDPERVLLRLQPLLSPDGVCIASIPNIRHYTAIMRLAIHGWQYEDHGLFDRTHLRFFSRGSMVQLFERAGMTVTSCIPRVVASKKALVINALTGGRLEEFLAFQYLLTAHPAAIR